MSMKTRKSCTRCHFGGRLSHGHLISVVYLLGIVVLALAVFSPAYAATITVNTTDDELNGDGDCSLREAIVSANIDTVVDACIAGSGADEIEFDAGLSGQTIGLALGPLEIEDDLTINGLGADELSVNGNGSDVFRIAIAGITVRFTGITVEGGDDGIAINGNNNTVTVSDSKIARQFPNDDGLEINGDGNTVIVVNSVFDDNEDNLGVEGNNNTVTVTNSTIKNASEDGLEIDGHDNTVTVVNSTLHNNGLFPGDPNDGLDIDGDRNVVTLQQVTFSANREDGLDIEGNNNTVTVDNSTFSGNGVIGIFIDNLNSTVAVQNTIIAENVGPDVRGDFNSKGNNLIGDGTGSTGFNGPGDIVGTTNDPEDPGLGAFEDGPPGRGHFPLLIGSQAIDAGNNDVCPNTDQIGNPRPVDGNGDGTAVCDIGAIELQTVVIDGCNTGVVDQVVNGFTISDQIAQCAADARNHGQFVSCVAHFSNDLKKAGIITGQEKGAIMSCAGQADIP